MTEIQKKLFELQDRQYADFQSRLIPNIEKERVIGVRTPALRALAKKLVQTKEAEVFLSDLPHKYFDENQLHAFLICEIKDFAECIVQTQAFLPYVDNWATCDQMSPKVFKKNTEKLLPYIEKWVASDRTYTVRFGICMLMRYFLDDAFLPEYAATVAEVRSDEYYINMMIAWYFATALAKQYDAILPFLSEHRLDPWVHHKTIQKAVESFRITPEQKAELKAMKVKG